MRTAFSIEIKEKLRAADQALVLQSCYPQCNEDRIRGVDDLQGDRRGFRALANSPRDGSNWLGVTIPRGCVGSKKSSS